LEIKIPEIGKGIPYKWKGHVETPTNQNYPLSKAQPIDKGGKEDAQHVRYQIMIVSSILCKHIS